MTGLRYLSDVVTLRFDIEKCNSCGECVRVCPHAVFARVDKHIRMVDRDACMECGACANNCPEDAIAVTPGTGCALAILASWFKGGEPSCGCGGSGCC